MIQFRLKRCNWDRMLDFLQRYYLYSNGVSIQELEAVAAMGVQVNIDNLSILEQFGAKHSQVPVCIRINPHVMAGGNANISVGHIDSKFGISIHQLPHILRIIENTNMHINGIHICILVPIF